MDKTNNKPAVDSECDERREREKRENAGYDALDKAVADTFPASDPPAVMGSTSIPDGALEKLKKSKHSR